MFFFCCCWYKSTQNHSISIDECNRCQKVTILCAVCVCVCAPVHLLFRNNVIICFLLPTLFSHLKYISLALPNTFQFWFYSSYWLRKMGLLRRNSEREQDSDKQWDDERGVTLFAMKHTLCTTSKQLAINVFFSLILLQKASESDYVNYMLRRAKGLPQEAEKYQVTHLTCSHQLMLYCGGILFVDID